MADEEQHGGIRAAGAVVWRPGATGPEIALVHRPRYDDWSYPKGKREPGEHVLITAVREVAEETGLRVVLGRPLTPTSYAVSAGIKHVSYWAARCVGPASGVALPNDEVDEVAWLPAEKVRERLSYERDVTVLEEFCSGPAVTSPLILLRHAEAGPKPAAGSGPDWLAADLARPLDARGAAEAALLATVLVSYGRCRVVSSAAERCTATVRPYAASVGVPVETEPAFTVAPGQPPEAARPMRAAELAAAGEPALICAHRENLPGLIGAAFDALGASPPDASPLRKSEFWTLQSARATLVSAERHGLES